VAEASARRIFRWGRGNVVLLPKRDGRPGQPSHSGSHPQYTAVVWEAADAVHRLAGGGDPGHLSDEVLAHASEMVRQAAWAILDAWPGNKLS
jgi:hypothetical protein